MVHISYTMFTRGLPDMYTLSPRACGPRTSGVHIRQTTRVHGITITYMHIYIYMVLKRNINVCRNVCMCECACVRACGQIHA